MTNWRNIVTRCKFLVVSLYNVNDAAHNMVQSIIFDCLKISWTEVSIKVARYSFSRSIPPKFERKLRRHRQRFGKIDTTVVLDKDETLLWSGLQRHRSCHSNEMTPLPILLAAVDLSTGNCSSKIVYWSFFLQ